MAIRLAERAHQTEGEPSPAAALFFRHMCEVIIGAGPLRMNCIGDGWLSTTGCGAPRQRPVSRWRVLMATIGHMRRVPLKAAPGARANPLLTFLRSEVWQQVEVRAQLLKMLAAERSQIERSWSQPVRRLDDV